MTPGLTRKLVVKRPDLEPKSAPASPASTRRTEDAPISAWVRLLRRIRIRRVTRGGRPDRLRIAPRALREARLAQCVPGQCESAQAIPGCDRAKCAAKGCGCDDLHAARLDATCPRGRWPASGAAATLFADLPKPAPEPRET